MYTFNEDTMNLIQSFQETLLDFRAEKETQRHAAAGKNPAAASQPCAPLLYLALGLLSARRVNGGDGLM